MSHDVEGFRLSPQQRRVWALPGPADRYRVVGRFAVEGGVTSNAMRTALADLVERHEILRTTFQCLTGMTVPIQVIGDASDAIEIEERDLSDASVDERRDRLAEVFDAAVRRPIALDTGPVLIATIARLSPSSHALVVALPAACADLATLDGIGRVLQAALSSGTTRAAEIEEPMQYADIAEWLNESLDGGNSEEDDDGRNALEARAHWDRTRKAAAAIRWPFLVDGEDGPDADGPAEVVRRQLDPAVAALLANHPTPADVLLAAWAVLMHRLVGESEIVFGIGLDGRGYEGLEDALGPLARTVPVSLTVDATDSFQDVVERTRGALETAEERQEVFSFEGPEHLAVGFDHVVLGGKAENDAASVTLEDVHSCLDRFDVRLRCVRRGDTLVTELHHDSRRLTAAAAGRLTSQLHVLIATALADPSQEVDLIDLLDEAEKQRVLVAFNETAPVDAPPLCMHELIGEQAERTPDAIALIGEAGEFTYAQLEARAERLADHLASLGVRRETRVGLCLERSPDLIVGLLAILKAGAAYVPMDPAYPSDRLAFMLEDTAASVVVTTRHHAGSLSGPTLAFADDESSWCGEETVPRATTDPDGAAYVIYTSGSTGRPKGVVVTHRNLVSSTWARTVYYREPVTRFLLVSSHAFDSSVAGIFWSLVQGAALVLPDEQAVRDVERLASLIEMHAVTHALCLPALWKLLLDQTEPERLASMRTVILAGEVCTASVTQAHHRRLPGCALFNEYGPTEGTVWSSVHEIAEPVHGAVPIGRPIPGATVYLLDGSGRPTPVGVAGELHVGGPGVARGYLDRPDLNSEHFVPDPFSSESGARLYRTGDLARWRDDGVLEFLGRLDHQIKIRGYRVELAEIETRLAQAPGVSEVAVVDRDESDGDKRIVAYVVPQEKPGPGAGELRRALEQSLPEYMIPSAFVSLDDLPRMPNGKVDRHSLPEPGSGRSDVLDDFVAPATQLEKRIAARWREVLDVEEVGVHDGFFHLGGNSIRAAILINKLRGDLGDVLRVADLFEKPRISELVALLAERSPEIAGQATAGASTIERVVESQGAIEARVDGMSDDEVRRLLADLMPGGGETGR